MSKNCKGMKSELKSVTFRDLFVLCYCLFETTALVNFKLKNGGTGGNKLKDERSVLSYSMTTQHMFLTLKNNQENQKFTFKTPTAS